MKRLLSIILCLLCVFLLAACTQDTSQVSTNAPIEEDYWNPEDYPEYDPNAKYSLNIEYEFAEMYKYVQNGKTSVVFTAKVLSDNHTLNSIVAYDKAGNKLGDEYEIKQYSGYFCLTDDFHATKNDLSHTNDLPTQTIIVSSNKDIDFNDFTFKFKVSHTEDKERSVEAKINSTKEKMLSDKKHIHGASLFIVDEYSFLLSGKLGATGNIGTQTYYNAIRVIPLFDNVEDFNLDGLNITAVNYSDCSDYEVPDGYQLYYNFETNSAGTFFYIGLKCLNGIMEEEMISVAQKLCPKITFENGDSIILLNVA